jgi:hypothetical protein
VAKRRGRIQSFYHPNRTRFGSNTTLNSTLSEGSANLNGSKSGVTLQRNLSFMSMSKRERKPFKFLEALRFPSFRMFFYTYGDGMFYLKMRDEMYEEMCSFRITGETSMPIAKDFFENMCTLVSCSFI